MEDFKMARGGLVAINVNESTKVHGGISWETIYKIASAIKSIVDFFFDYNKEMQDGFNDGWESVN